MLASSAWLRTDFIELYFPVGELACTGDHFWLHLRMQGRHTGAFGRYRNGALDQAVPPTGAEVDVEQIHLLRLREGRIVRHEAVRDDVTVLGRLGAFPPGPGALRVLAWKVTGRAARAAVRGKADLRGRPGAAAPEGMVGGLAGRAPFCRAPAACRWARTIVGSTATTAFAVGTGPKACGGQWIRRALTPERIGTNWYRPSP
ncbi:ester cyclase [Kitasatospora griseola]|uniref:ester cyclase n=1 Tax=Kitasatospora griseola TaxID=2064 RepID=UPI00381F7061